MTNCRFFYCLHYVIIAICVLIKVDHLNLQVKVTSYIVPYLSSISSSLFCISFVSFLLSKWYVLRQKWCRTVSVKKDATYYNLPRGKRSIPVKLRLRWWNRANNSNACCLPEQSLLNIKRNKHKALSTSSRTLVDYW